MKSKRGMLDQFDLGALFLLPLIIFARQHNMSPFIPHWTPMDFSADTRKVFKHVPLIQQFSLALFVNNQNASSPMHTEDVKRSSSSHDKESCRPCFYTGLATCAGFAGYFFYLATDPQNLKHRKFLLTGSAAWTLAGVYRYYLN